MLDNADMEVEWGDLLLDLHGDLWVAVDIQQPSIWERGRCIPARRMRGAYPGTVSQDERPTYLPQSTIVRVTHIMHELSRLKPERARLWEFWRQARNDAGMANVEVLRNRKRNLDSILRERGIRK